MGILIGLVKQIGTWEASARFALLVDLLLLTLSLVIVSTSTTLRTPAMIAAAGLFIVLQGILLWGNRNMVAPYTQAQRHFMAGEFEKARDVLRTYMDECMENGRTPTIDSLVLLGNAYRNLGQLRESESILRVAVARRPDYHFAQYGLARTRQAVGDYNSAINYLTEAIRRNAPAIVHFDLAFIQYLRGDDDKARAILNSIPAMDEVHRMLMTAYLYHVLVNQAAPQVELVEAGLPFWEAEIKRFGHMPYGRDLRVIVEQLRNLL